MPIKVLKVRALAEEYDLKHIKSCKVVKLTWHHETSDPLLSISKMGDANFQPQLP